MVLERRQRGLKSIPEWNEWQSKQILQTWPQVNCCCHDPGSIVGSNGDFPWGFFFGKCALRMIIVLNQNLSKECIWLENEICKYKNGVWTTKWRSERHNQEFKTFKYRLSHAERFRY